MSKRITAEPPEPKGRDHKGLPDPPPKEEPKGPEQTQAELETKTKAANAKLEEKPPDKIPTAEELAEQAKDVMSTFFPTVDENEKKEKAKAKKEAEKAIAPVEEPPAKEPEKKPEPEKKADEPPVVPVEEKKDDKKEPVLPPPISEAVKPEQLVPPPERTKQSTEILIVEDELEDDDRERLEALARLEKEGTVKKGIIEATKAFWELEEAYIAKWEKENPEDQFDSNAKEHAEFYKKNEPDVDDRAVKRAIRLNTEESIERRVEEKQAKKREEEDFKRQAKELAPQTAKAQLDAVTSMIADAGFKDLMEKDGKLVFDNDVSNAVKETNPHAESILMSEAERLSIQIAEADRLSALGGNYPFNEHLSVKTSDGDHILPHKMLSDFTKELETEIASIPPEQTLRDGKRFATHGQFTQQQHAILNSKATDAQKESALEQLDKNYYTIAWGDLKNALVAKYSGRAKARIEAAGGRKSKETATPKAETPPPAKVVEPEPAKAQAKAPSVSSSSDNVDTSLKSTVKGGITEETIVKSFWG